jgi:NAD(P)-dependent dehydrogenase (short-subunit alcohol dehydrogenase family)
MSERSGSFRLEGRRVVVTGGVQGIGYAIAQAVIEGGAAAVALLDLQQDRVTEAATELAQQGSAEVIGLFCDVSSYDHVRETGRAIEERWGQADVLVNNAGIAHLEAAESMAAADWDRILQVNLSAVFYCSRVFGSSMIEARSGTIVNIASMSGIVVNRPQPQVAYNVAKAGVIMLTKSLAAEWAPYGVRVNAVAPGYIRTSMTEDKLGTDMARDYWIGGTPLGRIGSPSEIANAVLFLASNAASFVTGEVLVADGGYTLW